MGEVTTLKETAEVKESSTPLDGPLIFSKELSAVLKDPEKFQPIIEDAAGNNDGLKKQLIARDERNFDEMSGIPENEEAFLSEPLEDQRRAGIERGNAVEPAIAKCLEPYGKVSTELNTLDGDCNKRITDVQVKLEKDLIIAPGIELKAGEILSIEIKAGGEKYLLDQLASEGHAEKQCQGHEGKSLLVVTEDFRNLSPEKQNEIRDRFRSNGTTIIVALPTSQQLDYVVDNAAANINRDALNERRVEDKKTDINVSSPFSTEINAKIRNEEELNIYIDANLQEKEVNGKNALVKDIDESYMDEDTGLTNKERMSRGLSPIDSNGETIELHHIGQDSDSPFAELNSEEHRKGGNFSILHDSNCESKIDRDEFNKERAEYWKARINPSEKQ